MTLSSLSTADITLEPWWKHAGFLWHPFEQLDAAQEEYLQEYFIEPPRFWEVSGRAHTVLYAPLGGGKTAARRMLEQQCLAGEIEGTLVVVCDDFACVLRQAGGNPRDVTAEMLTEEIMHQAAEIVFEHWMENIESFQETTAFHRRWVACFLGDWEARCDETLHKLGLAGRVSVQQVRGGATEELEALVGEALWPRVEMLATLAVLRGEPPEDRPAGEWLERLASTAQQLGFKAVYVLFDRVDGLPQTASPEGCAALVWPLLDSTALLSVPNIYFKLFLPLETRPLLEKTAGIRSQRVAEVVVEWDKGKLKELLRKRLWEASGGKHEELAGISEKEIEGVDNELIRYARTPRHLIRLGHRLFVEHERLSPESMYLTRRDLDAALEREREEEQRKQEEEEWQRKREEQKERTVYRSLVYRRILSGLALLVPLFILLSLLQRWVWGLGFALLCVIAVGVLHWMAEREIRRGQ